LKKNGFIFIETIIVTAILLASLMVIYSLYASSINQETRRLRYDDAAKLYETYYIKQYLESFDLKALKLKIDSGEKYVMIVNASSDLYGSLYLKESKFLSTLWSELNIQNIYLFGNNITDLVVCNDNIPETICTNGSLVNYLKTIDDGEANTYYLVVEYLTTLSGEKCLGKSCFSSYSSIKVGA